MRSLFTGLLLLVAVCGYGQLRNNIWYFGTGAGLDFSNGAPVAINNGRLHTIEATSVVCEDSSGNLLFYTNADTIWNRNHQVMQNGTGLFGDVSSTQGVLIVPQPGNDSLYYVITVCSCTGACANGGRVASYSVVNINGGNGLGAVTTKNVVLDTLVSEKLTAVHHDNCQDIWIVYHSNEDNSFYSHLLTDTGITEQVISKVGTAWSGPSCNGQMRISPNGQHIALAARMADLVQLFDFDNTTGMVSNPISLPTDDDPYGLCFSPNSSKLYVGDGNLGSCWNCVKQFDLDAGSPTAIIASETTITSGGNFTFGSFQLGRDGKMYMTKINRDSLAVIHEPNLLGTACNYQDNAVYLNGRVSFQGLPNFVESYHDPANALQADFLVQDACLNDSVHFLNTSTGQPTQWSWNFGNGSSNQSSFSPAYKYESPGNYAVTLQVSNRCFEDSITKTITVHQPPTAQINALGLLTFCEGDSVTLESAHTSGNLWQPPNLSTQSITVDTSGTFTLHVTDANGCKDSTNTTVTVKPNPPQPVITWDGMALNSSAAKNNLWYLNGLPIPSANGPQHIPTASGTYTVTVIEDGCTSTSEPYELEVSGMGTDILSPTLQLYPLMSTGQLALNGMPPQGGTIRIINVLGQVVEVMKLNRAGTVRIDASHLPDGWYCLTVSGGNETPVAFAQPFLKVSK